MQYLVGNWKSNETITQARLWLEEFKQKFTPLPPSLNIVLCAPFTDLSEINRFISDHNLPISAGAQNVCQYESGAHTGEVTAAMLSELVRFCLVGHSEVRRELGDDCRSVAQKTKQLLERAIVPIICLDTPYLDEQIKCLLDENLVLNNCIFAYEPLASIGTNHPADPQSVESIATEIAFLTDPGCPVLYGGSVTPQNIQQYSNLPGISGLLVGGASLDSDIFISLAQATY